MMRKERIVLGWVPQRKVGDSEGFSSALILPRRHKEEGVFFDCFRAAVPSECVASLSEFE